MKRLYCLTAAIHSSSNKIEGVDFGMGGEHFCDLLEAFHIIIVVFYHFNNLKSGIILLQSLCESKNAFRVTKNVLGAGDDSNLTLPKGHLSHESGCGLTGELVITSNVSQTLGNNIRIHGDHGDA